MLVALDFIGSLGGACTVAGRWPGRMNKGFRDGVVLSDILRSSGADISLWKPTGKKRPLPPPYPPRLEDFWRWPPPLAIKEVITQNLHILLNSRSTIWPVSRAR